MRKIISIILAVLLMMGLTACGETESAVKQEEGTLYIGVFEPLSGADAEAGRLELAGMELAHELYPEADGTPIELVRGDNKSDTEEALIAAEGLLDAGVSVVLGSSNDLLSLAGSDVFTMAEVPYISATGSNPLVTQCSEYGFRVNIVETFQGTMAAKYVYEELKAASTVVMRAVGDDRSVALSQTFSDKLIQLSGNEDVVAAFVDYVSGSTDYSRAVETLKETNVKVVYLPGSAKDSAEIITQAKKAGLSDITFIGTDVLNSDDFLSVCGEAAEGVIYTTNQKTKEAANETAKAFLKAYREKYGEEAEPTMEESLGFDAYLVAVRAVEQVQAGAYKTIRDAVSQTSQLEGATGSITLDANGDAIKPVDIMKITEGQGQVIYTAVPQWGNL